MKSQLMGLPCGIHVSTCFIRIEKNDKGALNISVLEENLQDLLYPCAIDGEGSHLDSNHASGTCEPSSVITTRIGNCEDSNLQMHSFQESIDHKLWMTSLLSNRLKLKYTWKVLMIGAFAKHHLFTIFFSITCILTSSTTRYHLGKDLSLQSLKIISTLTKHITTMAMM